MNARTKHLLRTLMLTPGTDEYGQGYQDGWADGRTALEQEYGDEWTPIAERVRDMRGRTGHTYEEILAARGEYAVRPGEYRTLPRDGDYMGGPVTWTGDASGRGTAA